MSDASPAAPLQDAFACFCVTFEPHRRARGGGRSVLVQHWPQCLHSLGASAIARRRRSRRPRNHDRTGRADRTGHEAERHVFCIFGVHRDTLPSLPTRTCEIAATTNTRATAQPPTRPTPNPTHQSGFIRTPFFRVSVQNCARCDRQYRTGRQ